MTEVTTIKGGLNNIGFMRHTVSEKGKNIIVCTLNSGNKWLFLSNPYYEENIEDSKTDKEFYKSPHQVPKYSIFKNGNKVSSFGEKLILTAAWIVVEAVLERSIA